MSEPQISQMRQIPQIKIKKCLISVISVISVISGSDVFFIFFFSSSLLLFYFFPSPSCFSDFDMVFIILETWNFLMKRNPDIFVTKVERVVSESVSPQGRKHVQ